MVETVIEHTTNKKHQKSVGLRSNSTKKPVLLSSVKLKDTKRTSTKISELDRVLGGGLVPGQVILIAGEPGIGKSTILLQLADKLQSVLYVSGEESATQIKIRAQRLGVTSKKISIIEETDIDSVIDSVSSSDAQPLGAVIVDSIQTMATSDLSGMAGSVGQVRECTYRLVKLAKSDGVVIFIVGHVTKQGSIAGPSVLMHLVDTVLWFEGDKTINLRLLRARKNRFGPTDEVGIFAMEDKGLISVDESGKMFITDSKKQVSGSVATSIMEGTRPILVEIQALVNPTKMAYPKRIAQGFDSKRLEMLIAVLQRRSGLPLYEQDVFVNVMGGISLRSDPSADLAICLAIASAYFDNPLPKNSLAIGEVGLLGDIREVTSQDKRIKEAKRLGYTTSISTNSCQYINQAIKQIRRN
jgi:DNA repair protein RadA/Sms